MPFFAQRVLALACVIAALGLTRAADDPRPMVGPGATRDEVIAAYGWPNGQSQSGTKEILSYAQGEVILENGRVDRVNFSPNVPWQAPKPKPPPATASTRKLPEAPVDFWLTNFEAASREAQRRNCRILALFTGSDWSPASRQFHDEVEYHPDFVNAFAGDFVFVKFDFPRGNPVPAKVSEGLLALRDRYNVTTYPTFLILSPVGDLRSRADLTKPEATASFRERVIAAIREARDADAASLQPAPVAKSEPAEPQPPVATTKPPDVAPPGSPSALAMWNAGRLILVALVTGTALVAFALWRLWRQARPGLSSPVLMMADRIDAAAGGMPTVNEMTAWPKEKLRAITAALAEFDNYGARIRAFGADFDIELHKRGDVKPRVLACCSPGSAGVVSTKRLRELFASLAAEGVDNGWFVSPAGFSADARAYAASHRIVLVTSEGLHAMMREVPPVSLPGVLARE